jgi:predicted dehydrogenase
VQNSDAGSVKVGILTCHPTTGHIRPAWAPVIGPREGQPRRTDMVMSHVWDGEPGQAEAFVAEYGGEAVADYREMIGQVDGVILGDHHQIFDFKHLVRPFLEAGVPIFVNRPFAFCMADAREIVELAREHETPLMCGSSFEYVKEVGVIRRQLEAAGRIRGYLVDNAAGEYAWHGIHGLWMALACVGGGVRRVAHLCADSDPNGVGAIVLEHEGRDGGSPFHGCIQPTGNQGWVRVYGEKGKIEQALAPEGSQWDRDTYLWLPMLLRMQEMFQHGRMPETYEQILEKVQIFLAGFKSHIACGGAPVALGEIGDWVAPNIVEPRFEVAASG